ncbi:MAG: response regulator, partial [Gammaproteobacteria bacterium]|nr:response regulator [Gammaproteobacteria bacterium]NIW47314.1 hypothetical protein [Gammaproteobacteria bacterium]NIX00893.1 hypothetical protein [Phycisphaerae bacterium]
RILIIDDEECIRDSLAIFAEDLGLDPVVASAPEQCTLFQDPSGHCCKSKSCTDILLIDNHLPGISGLDFIELQLEKGCKVAVSNKAVMSGAFSSRDYLHAKNLGCHVLQKPVTYELFCNWINNLAVIQFQAGRRI